MAAASGNASRVRVAGVQNRPTSRSPSSIPAGIAASSGAAALAGRPSDPLYGTISDSAPATSHAGSHCASSKPRTVRSLNNWTLPATVARTTPRAGPLGNRAARCRRPSRVMTAAVTSAPPADSSSQRTGTAASTTPPTPSPAIWLPAPARLKTERPRT